MARAQGANALMALAYEAVYGTAETTGYKQMPFATSSLGTEQPLLESELLGQGRDPAAPVLDAVQNDGSVIVPIDALAIGYWLKGLLGPPTTTGTTPKTHTFVSGAAALPSMSIEVGHPEVPAYEMNTGVMVDSMKFTMGAKGLLQATVGLIGRNGVIAGATGAGSPAAIALTRLGHFNGAIKRDGVALANITTADLTYSNNLDKLETVSGGGKIEGADPTMASLKGNMNARFADITLLTQAAAGAPCSLEFSWVLSASVSLTLTAHAVYLPRPRREISGPNGVQVSFDWQAAKAVSPARMFTAALINGQASY